jgi:hypothetical protein
MGVISFKPPPLSARLRSAEDGLEVERGARGEVGGFLRKREHVE